MKAIIAILGVSLILLASSQGLYPTSSSTTCTLTGCAYCSSFSLTGYNTCGGCSSGFYSSGSQVCVSCGTTVTNSGSCTINGSTITVTGCAAGYYFTAGTPPTCTACTPAAAVATCSAAATHLTCQPGYYLSGSTCTLCMAPTASSATLAPLASSSVTGCTLCNAQNTCVQCSGTAVGGNIASLQTAGANACTNTANPVIANCFLSVGTGTTASCTLCNVGTTAATTFYVTAPITGNNAAAGTCTAVTAVIPNCLAYTSATVCSICAAGWMPNAAGTACTQCTSFAASPSGTLPLSCTTCATGYYGASGTCTACPTNCATCSSATQCLTCTGTYYVGQTGLCVSGTLTDTNCLVANSTSTCVACKANYAVNTTSVPCGACPTNCGTCSNATTCTACATGYTLNTTNATSCYNASAKSASILFPAFALISSIFYFLF